MNADLLRHAARARWPRLRPVPAWLLALIAACAVPSEMVHVPSGERVGRGTLIVSNAGAASVSFMDALTGDRIVDLHVGEGAGDVAVSPDGRLAVVSIRGPAADGHSLAVIDVRASTVAGSIELGQHGRPGGLQFLPDGKHLFVASGLTGRLLVVSAVSRRLVRALSTEQPRSVQLVLQPDAKRVWVSHGDAGTVTATDVGRQVLVTTLPVGTDAQGLDAHPDNRTIWVCDPADEQLIIIDTGQLCVTARLPCTGGPTRVRFTPDGRRAFVACAGTGDVAVFAVDAPRLLVRIPLALTPLETGDSRLFGRSLASGTTIDCSPAALLPSHDGQHVWVSLPSANIVTELDLVHLDVSGRLRAGQQPLGLAWTPELPGQR